MNLEKFLNYRASELLAIEPFSGWAFRSRVEHDLPQPEVYYEFPGLGVDFSCDEDERIRSIFVHRGAHESVTVVPFTLGRQQVLARLGDPEKSGAALNHQFLGVKGAWDRFSRPTSILHVQYRTDLDEIEMITLMRPDVAP